MPPAVKPLDSYPIFYGTRSFITVFTRASTCSYPERDQSSQHYPIPPLQDPSEYYRSTYVFVFPTVSCPLAFLTISTSVPLLHSWRLPCNQVNCCCSTAQSLLVPSPTGPAVVIPVFSLLDILNQNVYPLLDMFVFRNMAFSSTTEGSVFLCRRYVCCTVVSARVYLRSHGVQITMDSVHPLPLHCTKNYLCNIHEFPVSAGLCNRMCLNLCQCQSQSQNYITTDGQ
jgi:hypothetical protein